MVKAKKTATSTTTEDDRFSVEKRLESLIDPIQTILLGHIKKFPLDAKQIACYLGHGEFKQKSKARDSAN